MATIKASPGAHIRDLLAEALMLAADTGEVVTFDFNGLPFLVDPDDHIDDAKARASEVLGFPVMSHEEEMAFWSAEADKTKDEYDEADRTELALEMIDSAPSGSLFGPGSREVGVVRALRSLHRRLSKIEEAIKQK